jgi:hypothetical protein
MKHHIGVQMIIYAYPQKALLPGSHKILPAPLIFGMQAPPLMHPECAGVSIPANGVVIAEAGILGGSLLSQERDQAYDQRKK